jgi:hypothetical protein
VIGHNVDTWLRNWNFISQWSSKSFNHAHFQDLCSLIKLVISNILLLLTFLVFCVCFIFVFVRCLVYPMLPVYLDCTLLIVLSVFPNVFLCWAWLNDVELHWLMKFQFQSHIFNSLWSRWLLVINDGTFISCLILSRPQIYFACRVILIRPQMFYLFSELSCTLQWISFA